jgi:hypothetical protein
VLRCNTWRETTLVKILIGDDEANKMKTDTLLIRDGQCRLKHLQMLPSRRAGLGEIGRFIAFVKLKTY